MPAFDVLIVKINAVDGHFKKGLFYGQNKNIKPKVIKMEIIARKNLKNDR